MKKNNSSNLGHPMKMVAKVKVQSFSDKTLRVKLSHARFYANGNEVNLTEAHQSMETEMGQGGSMGHTEQTFKKFLEEPMLVYTKRGLIKKLIVSENEPSEVTEMKKLLATKLEMSNGDDGLQLIKKQAISTPLETPRIPMKVDLGNYRYVKLFILKPVIIFIIIIFINSTHLNSPGFYYLACLRPIRVFVKTTGGKATGLIVDPQDTIENLKARIESKLQIPMTSQVLLFGGKVLKDAKRIVDYGIKNQFTILVVEMKHGKYHD